MPRKLERKLRAEAQKKGLGQARANAYVYGTLRRLKRRKERANLNGSPVDRLNCRS